MVDVGVAGGCWAESEAEPVRGAVVGSHLGHFDHGLADAVGVVVAQGHVGASMGGVARAGEGEAERG